MNACIHGVPGGCDERLRQLWPFLVTKATRLSGNVEDGEDIAQEASVRLWKAWERIDLTHLSKYAGRVVTRVFFDSLRAKGRRVIAIPASQIQPADWEDILESFKGDDAGLSVEDKAVFDGMFARLTPPLKDVMGLFLYGMSYEEMAEVLSIPVGTVRSRLHRARDVMQFGAASVERQGSCAALGVAPVTTSPQDLDSQFYDYVSALKEDM
jgi:RNA polymerase sigma-70 factor (ECF subfamily)